MNLRTMKRPDGLWQAWDDDKDPGPEHAYDTPHHDIGIGETKQEAADDFFLNVLGWSHSVRVA